MNWAIKNYFLIYNQNFAHFVRGYDKGGTVLLIIALD